LPSCGGRLPSLDLSWRYKLSEVYSFVPKRKLPRANAADAATKIGKAFLISHDFTYSGNNATVSRVIKNPANGDTISLIILDHDTSYILAS
jgi:hypothetical protein